MIDILQLVAMAPPPSQDGQTPGTLYYVGLMGLMMAIFYVVLIRPQRRREKQRQEMLGAVKTGDRVLFSGGILGTVTNVKERTFTIKVADKVRIEVSRGAVSHVLEKGELPQETPS
jgi:preprotein translocase subunit YajC